MINTLQIAAASLRLPQCLEVSGVPGSDPCSAWKSEWRDLDWRSLHFFPNLLWQYLAEQIPMLVRGCGTSVDMLPLREKAAAGFPQVIPSPMWGSSPDVFSEAGPISPWAMARLLSWVPCELPSCTLSNESSIRLLWFPVALQKP